MSERKELSGIFGEMGYTDVTWIDPGQIVVSQWVRMKCSFGCPTYGRCASCPPNTPSVTECREFFSEYEKAAILRFNERVDPPESRHQSGAEINRKLLELERAVFLAGYPKAFLIFMDNCSICKECADTRSKCRVPASSRPSPEAMAVDVFATVRQAGLPIEVLENYTDPMNRYAFLMVE